MSFHQFQLKKQESAENILFTKLNKMNSRKNLAITRQKSYIDNLKISKNNVLPNIYTLGKNELNTKTIFEESNNENKKLSFFHPKLKSNKLIKRISFKKSIIQPLNFFNVNTKQNITKSNDNYEKKESDNLSFPKTLDKDEINIKKIKRYSNIESKKCSVLNNLSNLYTKSNKITPLFKYISLSPLIKTRSNIMNPQIHNLHNYTQKMEIPKINSSMKKNQEIIHKNELNENKKEREIRIMKIKTDELDESNSFLNEIKDIISVCVTPIKSERKTSKDTIF